MTQRKQFVLIFKLVLRMTLLCPMKLHGDIRNICCYTFHQHFEASQSLECEHMSTKSQPCFWFAGFDFHVMLTSHHCATSQSYHVLECHFHLTWLLWSFDVGREYKIYSSAFGRYTVNCGILPIANTQIDHAEVARYTFSVGCSTGLVYCIVFADQADVFLSHASMCLCALLDHTCLTEHTKKMGSLPQCPITFVFFHRSLPNFVCVCRLYNRL